MKNRFGSSPLIRVSRGSAPEAITVLIKAGADVNAKSNDGFTPLLTAAKDNKNPEVITILVEAEADVNAKNKDGKTPLMLAADYNTNPEAIITTLLQHGADPRIKDNTGKMAIDYARNNEKLKNTEALRRLEEVSK